MSKFNFYFGLLLTIIAFVGFFVFGWEGKNSSSRISQVWLSVQTGDEDQNGQDDWIFHVKMLSYFGHEKGCDCNFTLQLKKANESDWHLLAQDDVSLNGISSTQWTKIIYNQSLCGDMVFRVVAREDRFAVLMDRVFTKEHSLSVPCWDTSFPAGDGASPRIHDCSAWTAIGHPDSHRSKP